MESRWSDADAAALPDLDGLLYVSRLVGQEPALVLWGGGNTSVKRTEHTALDEDVPVLRVKGSGSDLKSVQPRDFPGLRLDSVQRLRARATLSDDDMLAYLALCAVESGSARPSIETLLHSWLPARYVVHTHADAILGVTNTPHGRRWVAEAFEGAACFIPYVRPGFDLAKAIDAALQAQPDAQYVVMEKHGLTTWGDTPRAAYEATIAVCSRAEQFLRERARTPEPFGAGRVPPLAPPERRRVYVTLAPTLRQLATAPLEQPAVSSQQSAASSQAPGAGGQPLAGDGQATRPLYRALRFDDGADVLEFVGSTKAEALASVGPATPDHMLHTKLRPLYVPWDAPTDPAAAETALRRAWEVYAADYTAYVEAGGRSGGLQEAAGGGVPAALLAEAAAPRPRVVLLPGVGMVTIGKDARAAGITADIYHHAIGVMRAAEALDAYASLERPDAFDVEFWPLELYKLTTAAPDGELARRVALITGGGNGIGRAIARRFAAAGAHVVVTDLDAAAAEQVASELVQQHGAGRALGVALDVTNEASVAAGVEAAVLGYGGLDVVVSNAGIAPVAPIVDTALATWQRSLDVNATGHFLVARAALRLFQAQGRGGSMVFVATKNTLAPGSSFAAYSAAKAAELQLARVLAIEGGPLGVRVNIVNPDAVFQDTGLWTPAMRAGRAAQYGIAVEALPDYYRQRNLLQAPIYAEDVAEAALYFASDRAAKTTGCILTVDGGLREAFPR
ncbi:MAG TPA: bifunctional aldolase/short-chain dehydrogenase [Chloroflexota bacterium]|jgi:rhamnose utilization protein RhaD (predicted bifunctional aldolase and dehydrogenase)/NAD(P)-dependent dehydrogenase (short-subunit alcohol dehydrogenase family)